MIPQLTNALEQLMLQPRYTLRILHPRSTYTLLNALIILICGVPIVVCISTLTTFNG